MYSHLCQKIASTGRHRHSGNDQERYCNTALHLSRKEEGGQTWSVAAGDRHLRQKHPESQRAQHGMEVRGQRDSQLLDSEVTRAMGPPVPPGQINDFVKHFNESLKFEARSSQAEW